MGRNLRSVAVEGSLRSVKRYGQSDRSLLGKGRASWISRTFSPGFTVKGARPSQVQWRKRSITLSRVGKDETGTDGRRTMTIPTDHIGGLMCGRGSCTNFAEKIPKSSKQMMLDLPFSNSRAWRFTINNPSRVCIDCVAEEEGWEWIDIGLSDTITLAEMLGWWNPLDLLFDNHGWESGEDAEAGLGPATYHDMIDESQEEACEYIRNFFKNHWEDGIRKELQWKKN